MKRIHVVSLTSPQGIERYKLYDLYFTHADTTEVQLRIIDLRRGKSNQEYVLTTNNFFEFPQPSNVRGSIYVRVRRTGQVLEVAYVFDVTYADVDGKKLFAIGSFPYNEWEVDSEQNEIKEKEANVRLLPENVDAPAEDGEETDLEDDSTENEEAAKDSEEVSEDYSSDLMDVHLEDAEETHAEKHASDDSQKEAPRKSTQRKPSPTKRRSAPKKKK